MATATTQPTAAPPAPVDPRAVDRVERAVVTSPRGVLFRLSADQYLRLVEAGVIPGDRRVELWEGLLVEKMAKLRPHSISQAKLNTALVRNVPAGWYVAPECPIELDEDKVPLPDVTVVRGNPDDYPQRPPVAANVGIVVEVADSSLRKDLGSSLQAYAARLIPVYWVVNLRGRRVEVYSRPTVREGVAEYEALLVCGLDDQVPLVLDGREIVRIPARDILPAEPTS